MKWLIVILSIISLMAVKDLTPKLKSKLKTAEQEFTMNYQHGSLPFGESSGGLQMYSKVFKRGYGDEVFGSDDNGIWLGAADFDDAPFSVNMSGRATFKDEDDTTFIDSKGLVSTASFISDTTTKSDNQTLNTDNNWTDIDDLNFNISLARESNVLFFGIIQYKITGNEADPLFRIDYGSGQYPGGDGWQGNGAVNDVTTVVHPFTFTQLLTLPAGDLTVKMQGTTSTSDETVSFSTTMGQSTFGYVTLGK